MPKREDIHHVLVIGSGPIVIGQACEFDYSGTQACSVFKEEGIRVTLINSNPATIMTDPAYADATYIEPITIDFIRKILEDQKAQGHPIDSVIATIGGQTALNVAAELHKSGTLDEFGIKLIGANYDSIAKGEDRAAFKEIVENAGGETARSIMCHSMNQVYAAVEELGYPVIIRPSFTLGGLGSGIAHNKTELTNITQAGLAASPVSSVLIEESILGWKEYELELMRDCNDNVVVVCGIENLDPVGVHTGDSITVAPIMTLTDREFQKLRDLSIAILRLVGVDTGGCNIQFAVNPYDGRIIVIEMNPRVSRSSALASKATGFPIAKISAKLALGYTLDEIMNDITGNTPACFEPSIDYVVVKAPRFAFEKFPGADPRLTTTMKSVGEAMALGRNFIEAFHKAFRSLDRNLIHVPDDMPLEEILKNCAIPTENRIAYVRAALDKGADVDKLHTITGIDPWFLYEIQALGEHAQTLAHAKELTKNDLALAKNYGFSDKAIAQLRGEDESEIRKLRHSWDIRPKYKNVDTCAAEFKAVTPYHYSAYELDPAAANEIIPSKHKKDKVIILGSGPNRIGQGVEFDYSCVHAAKILSHHGYETIMINCNPETVSTDYDTSDRLFFEPVTFEDVLEIYHAESQVGTVAGLIVQLGGQTPLSIAQELADAGIPILGTSPEDIHRAEDRKEFSHVLTTVGLQAPTCGTALSIDEALEVAAKTGYPALVRPSYVLGGAGMEIVYDDDALKDYVSKALQTCGDHPILIDTFLEDAIEIDVDALCDGTDTYIAGIMEHIEEAGIHSGDSACVIPPITLSSEIIDEIISATDKLAKELHVRGLLNVQFALKDNQLYVLEANPRASRTVPFVSKSTGISVAQACTRIMVGTTIAQLRQEGALPQGQCTDEFHTIPTSVKEAVLPFKRFLTRDGFVVDSLLGPEMKSTGEVMGIDSSFDIAFAKSQLAAYGRMPLSGKAIISVADKYKPHIVETARQLTELDFELFATDGTATYLQNQGISCHKLHKHSDTNKPDNTQSVVDIIREGSIDIVINIPSNRIGARTDGYEIRAAASSTDTICITTTAAAKALVAGIKVLLQHSLEVTPLQKYAKVLS